MTYFACIFVIYLQETWAYMEMYMDNILHEAFVNMFQENPDLKEKFIASKENAANGRRRKYICNLIVADDQQLSHYIKGT